MQHWLKILLGILFLCVQTTVLADPALQKQFQTLDEANSVPAKATPHLSASELKNYLRPKDLFLRSSAALVWDERDDIALYERRANKPRPIASITKLMTAMVTLDADLPMDEAITIMRDDRDKIRRSRSRLRYGTQLTRADMLLMALAASENRAANALGRTYPGGTKAFVKAMNAKSKQLGLIKTRFMDAAGLHGKNLSTPRELALLIDAAYQYPLIREMTTTDRSMLFDMKSGRAIAFLNTNRLIRNGKWDIDLSKTGFISEAGFCLVMRAKVAERPITIVLLNSWGKLSKYGDANRIKTWLIQTEQKVLSLKNSLASIN
jgi:D-alanyl-D-alanine endopeptidase (penicillin-binding protein 7)